MEYTKPTDMKVSWQKQQAATLVLCTFFGVFMLPLGALAAEILIEQRTEQVQPNDVFLLPIRIDASGECVNAIEATIEYDTKYLTIIDVARGRSILPLWTEEPVFNKEEGRVHFSGGIPGGYCGRVIGDPGLTNILGELVFLVRDTGDLSASTSVTISKASVHAHDGNGTLLPTTVGNANVGIVANLGREPLDEWIFRVKEDTTAPELFDVILNTDISVARGRYYIVFSTTDKQSGIDHYEVLETDPERWGFLSFISREAKWLQTESPHVLQDQSLRSTIQVKAVDKSGNERIVTFHPPEELVKHITLAEIVMFGVGLLFLIIFFFIGRAFLRHVIRTADSQETPVPPSQPEKPHEE